MEGYPDGRFRPDGAISREEFMAVLAKAKGLRASGGSPSFQDVDPGRWSFPLIQALTNARIVHPEDYEGRLRPETPVTRMEIAVMLVRAAGLEGELVKTAELTSLIRYHPGENRSPPWP